jgi:XTP/dITP diphosphohydrolase
MDRLRSPGGCPWDAAQTHQSLARYLLEETYEAIEAIELDDDVLLREELGDLLLQVLFHARVAEELPDGQRFSIDDVASDLVDKLVRRHPHVFDAAGNGASTGAAPLSAGQVNENWEQLKAVEKQRSSLTDGVPIAQPALAYAGKLVSRVERAGLEVAVPPTDEFGERLLAVVRDAVAAGVDPESALRRTTRAYRDAILRAEAQSAP